MNDIINEDKGEIVLSIKLFREGTKIKFEVLKSGFLTESEDKCLNHFIKDKVLDNNYDSFIDVERVLKK